ncbi:MAG: GUN4 domain-containing protein [Cyanobacteria bacterium J06642_2]
MTPKPHFDVFLCHNSEDKTAIIEIANGLKSYSINPWLDVWELRPGAIWQFALEQQIENIGAAAVFVGQQGVGPWQSEEIYAFLQEFIQRKCPVIPVMLPDAPKQPRLPIFLKNRHWVDYRLQAPDPLEQLIWGITDKRPERSVRNGAEPKPPIEPTLEEDVLASEKGVDYTRLQDLLKAQNFKDADYETYVRMLEAVGREDGDVLREEEVLKFPCTDLKTIDCLWVKYSKGRFGFSVQKEIYVQCGAKLDGKYPSGKIWREFGDRVGWRMNSSWLNYSSLTFTMRAPQGHLPRERYGMFRYFCGCEYIFSRIETCKL